MFVGSWNWIPGILVGPFRFGSDASDVIARYNLRQLEPACSDAFWDNYEIPGYDSQMTVEDGKISSVACYEYLYHGGFNLIRLNLKRVEEILGLQGIAETRPYIEGMRVTYYDSLGLTIFSCDEIIDSATCNEVQES